MDEINIPPQPPRPVATPSGCLPWLVVLLLVLTALWVTPYFVERIQYASTRGRERAQVDVARANLPSPTLEEISRQFALIAKAIEPSVVHIDTVQIVSRDRDEVAGLFFPRQFRAQGQGSGVIVDADGYILTNYHVVENARDIRVRLTTNETRTADVVGLDPVTDLAVLKIASGGLIAAEWGNSDALEVGSLVWAVGNPFGLDRSVTFGIISAKSRRGFAGVSPYQDFLQTDAAVNPGNSGGPLVDVGGKIVGINTAIVGRTYQGISFSIPSGMAHEVYTRLREYGQVSRGYLGVELIDLTPELAERLEIKAVEGGALVRSVGDSSPAAKAGIEPGDVIVSWNGHRVGDATELTLLIGKAAAGSQATVGIIRDGKPQELTVTVGERPQAPAAR